MEFRTQPNTVDSAIGSAILLFAVAYYVTMVVPPPALANQSLLVDVKGITKSQVYIELQRDLSGGDRLNQHCVNTYGKA